jgi:hypothetical protein
MIWSGYGKVWYGMLMVSMLWHGYGRVCDGMVMVW